MKQHFWKIVALLAVVALGASIVYSQYVSGKADENIVIKEHIKGNPDASVTLVEYSDFQCPACAQFEPIVRDLIDTYGDKMNFEYRHFPLINIHPNAVPAAVAAEAAAQQDKFWEMHDMLFENQTAWSGAAAPNGYFEAYAQEIGLDMDQFKLQIHSSKLLDAVKDSFNEARDLGLTSTPTFYLNGEKMEYSTFGEFTDAIEAAIGVAPAGTSSAATATSTVN